jgi:hypothetical protein
MLALISQEIEGLKQDGGSERGRAPVLCATGLD